MASSLGAFESQMVLESETIARQAIERGRRGGDRRVPGKRKPQFPGKARAEAAHERESRLMLSFAAALAAALVLIVVRVYFKLRAVAGARVAELGRADHRAAALAGLRAVQRLSRWISFSPLPDESSCQDVRARLEPEFSVDVKPMPEEAELPSACTPPRPCG